MVTRAVNNITVNPEKGTTIEEFADSLTELTAGQTYCVNMLYHSDVLIDEVTISIYDEETGLLIQNDTIIANTYDFIHSKNFVLSDAGNYSVRWSLYGAGNNTLLHQEETYFMVEAVPIYLDGNGGSVSSELIKVNFGQTFSALSTLTAVREGYAFRFWSKKPDDLSGLSRINSTTPCELFNDEKQKASLHLYAIWQPVTYSLTIDANGGIASITSKIVEYDSPYGDLPTPERDGFIFVGWYTKLIGGERIFQDSIVKVTGKPTIYARWQKRPYIVYYNGNGGDVARDSNVVYYLEDYGVLPIPTRSGYQFMGWQTSLIEGEMIHDYDVVNQAKNHTLYASWKKDALIYVMKYDANGGEVSIATKEIRYGSEYGPLAIPVRKGYQFLGWSSIQDGNVDITAAKKVNIDSDHTIYAKWQAKEYTITFEYNEAEAGMSPLYKQVTYDGTYGDLPLPTRTGFIFMGWYDSPTGTKKVTADTIVQQEEPHSLYARWQGEKYLVHYFVPAGTVIEIEQEEKVYGDPYGDLPVPVQAGFHFLGWYLEVDLVNLVTPSSIMNQNAVQVLYAKWAENAAVAILKYELNGGTMANIASEIQMGKVFGKLPVPQREGYYFEGWFTAAIDGEKITDEMTVPLLPNDGMTVYARWSPLTYKVSFADGNDVDTYPALDITYLSPYGELPYPSKEGYTFIGWFASLTDTTPVTNTTIFTKTQALTLHAKWERDQYQVTFEANGGQISETDRVVSYGEEYGNLPEPEKRGYTFAGWFTLNEGGNEVLFDTIAPLIANNKQTLYARWAAKKYVVKFENDGEIDAALEREITYDELYGELPRVNKKGYTLLGWFTALDGGEKITSETKFNATTSQTLYARWQLNQYKITFQINGGQMTESFKVIAYGASYGELPTPTKVSNRFEGWFTSNTSGERITSATKMELDADHTIYARWTLFTERKVSFHANGGTVNLAAAIVQSGSKYGKLPVPTRTGYDFLGWYTQVSGGTRILEQTIVTTETDHTLFARWKIKSFTITLNPVRGSVAKKSVVVKFQGTYSNLPTPTRSNYKFLGWYTAASGGRQISASMKLVTNKNHTLYARWSVIKPGAVKSAKAVIAAATKVKLTWASVPGAKGYEIYRAASKKGKYTKLATIKKVKTKTYTDKKVRAGKTYYYRIKAYKVIDKKNVYGANSKTVNRKVLGKLATPVIQEWRYHAERLTLRWKGIKNADQILICIRPAGGKEKVMKSLPGKRVTDTVDISSYMAQIRNVRHFIYIRAVYKRDNAVVNSLNSNSVKLEMNN
jgi:uncharacterized repeat protein (TIGR02543 family)